MRKLYLIKYCLLRVSLLSSIFSLFGNRLDATPIEISTSIRDSVSQHSSQYSISLGSNLSIARKNSTSGSNYGEFNSKVGGSLGFNLIFPSKNKMKVISGLDLYNRNFYNAIGSSSLGSGVKYDTYFNLYHIRIKFGCGIELLKSMLFFKSEFYCGFKLYENSKGEVRFYSINSPVEIKDLNGKSNQYKPVEIGITLSLLFQPSQKKPYYFYISNETNFTSTLSFYSYSNKFYMYPSFGVGISF